jgi:hypothetical protein
MRAVVLCTLALFGLTAVCVSAQYTPAAQADKITSLPGLATMPTFNMFSGYLVVDAATNKSIFYCQAHTATAAREEAMQDVVSQ